MRYLVVSDEYTLNHPPPEGRLPHVSCRMKRRVNIGIILYIFWNYLKPIHGPGRCTGPDPLPAWHHGQINCPSLSRTSCLVIPSTFTRFRDCVAPETTCTEVDRYSQDPGKGFGYLPVRPSPEPEVIGQSTGCSFSTDRSLRRTHPCCSRGIPQEKGSPPSRSR